VRLSQRGVPIMILSLSIQPILDELKNNIGFISDAIGNKITVSNENFVDYEKPFMSCGEDKLNAFITASEKRSFACPLIIGHSDDEIPLVRHVRQHNGFSIGINPKKHLESEFDIVLRSVNWDPLVKFISAAR